MSGDNSWLKAYEAEKAKALERLSAVQSGTSHQQNVSGLSRLSGTSSSTKKPAVSSIEKRKLQPPPTSTDMTKKSKTEASSALEVMAEAVGHDAVHQDNTSSHLQPGPGAQAATSKHFVNNRIHEAIDEQKLASIRSFEQRIVHPPKPPVEKVTKPPSVASMIKKVKTDAKRDVKDWQREYEERKKAAMAAAFK